MLDQKTLTLLKMNKDLRQIKIKNIEFAIKQIQAIINEGEMNTYELNFLKIKLDISKKNLKILKSM